MSFQQSNGSGGRSGRGLRSASPQPLATVLAITCPVVAAASVPLDLAIPTAMLGWILAALALIDARRMLLPLPLTIGVAALGLLTISVAAPQDLPTNAQGAIAGWAALRCLALVHRWLRGRDGLGEGDAWLAGALGVWVGPSLLPSVVLLASISALAAIVLAARRHRRALRRRWPFGPHLAVAGYFVWLLAAAPAR